MQASWPEAEVATEFCSQVPAGSVPSPGDGQALGVTAGPSPDLSATSTPLAVSGLPRPPVLPPAWCESVSELEG